MLVPRTKSEISRLQARVRPRAGEVPLKTKNTKDGEYYESKKTVREGIGSSVGIRVVVECNPVGERERRDGDGPRLLLVAVLQWRISQHILSQRGHICRQLRYNLVWR